MHPANLYNLVADIGGTNTRVALVHGRAIVPGTVRRYANADHPGLESVLRQYSTDEGGVDVRASCVAVAGPVRHGRATMTNLDWTIDETTVARASGAEVTAILNDLQAQGFALGHLAAGRIRTVLPFPETGAGEARLVIGVGTGFNASPVFAAGPRRIVPASESGHVNLPVRDEADMRLARFVSAAHGFAAVEDVLSGRGLEAIYLWLGTEAGEVREAKARTGASSSTSRTTPSALRGGGRIGSIRGGRASATGRSWAGK